ncbi:MAG: hypothetical protein ABH867_00750 [Patescibacteria group bacterium]
MAEIKPGCYQDNGGDCAAASKDEKNCRSCIHRFSHLRGQKEGIGEVASRDGFSGSPTLRRKG